MNIRYILALSISLAASQIAVASTYQQANALFLNGEPASLSDLLATGETIDRSGRCVSIYAKNQVESRAFVASPLQGEFGPSLFISFEHFDSDETDEAILAYSQTTFRQHWGLLYEEFGGVLQSARVNSTANHYIEYRQTVTASGQAFLIRKYYADEGVFGPSRRTYIAAFDGIEYCWVRSH